MDDQEMIAKLKERSTPELIELRRKARLMDTPQAWAVRFQLIKILLVRHMLGEEV